MKIHTPVLFFASNVWIEASENHLEHFSAVFNWSVRFQYLNLRHSTTDTTNEKSENPFHFSSSLDGFAIFLLFFSLYLCLS